MNTTRSSITAIARIGCIVLMLLSLAGCSIYKINIQQGNYLDQNKIDEVKIGMTRNQVKYLMGTPMIADTFHNDRWDYVYYAKFGRGNRLIERKVTIYFDGDGVINVDQYGHQPAQDNTSDPNPPES